MRRLSPLHFVVIALAALMPPLGCNAFANAFKPSSGPTTPPRMPDEPAPLHTGGFEATVGQGSGTSPASHGDPNAAAIATGIGLAVLGTGVATTAAACAGRDASAACLRGPGPADFVDAGAR